MQDFPLFSTLLSNIFPLQLALKNLKEAGVDSCAKPKNTLLFQMVLRSNSHDQVYSNNLTTRYHYHYWSMPCVFSNSFCAQNVFVAWKIIAIFSNFFRDEAKVAGFSYKNVGDKTKCKISHTIIGWLTAMISELLTYLFTPSLSSSSVIRDKLGSFCEPRMRLNVRASSLTLS